MPHTIARPIRPGVPEMITAAITYAVLLAAGIAWIWQIPAEQDIYRGNVTYFVSGAAGVGAFVAAVALRIRDLRTFGFRRAGRKWLVIGAAMGVVVYLLNLVTASVYVAIFGNDTPQADYQAAASGGALALALTLLTGAILTPLGEELMFRGVIANALNRYGAWAGVILSAAIFALVHGISIILPIAFVVGVISGILFRKTGSVWPSFLVHAVYNGISNIVFALVLSN